MNSLYGPKSSHLSNQPFQPSSSPHSTHQYETHTELSSPMSHGESIASCPSPSDIRTTVPTTRNSHPIYICLSYHQLSPFYFSFVSSISSLTIPKNIHEALDRPRWQQAMIVEIQALESNGAWELVPLPLGKKTVGCRWVYAIKVGPNSELITLRLDRWQKDTHRYMVLIMVIPFLQRPNSPQSIYSLLWLPFAIGLFINWIIKMLSYMVTQKGYTWSKPLGLMLRGNGVSL